MTSRVSMRPRKNEKDGPRSSSNLGFRASSTFSLEKLKKGKGGQDEPPEKTASPSGGGGEEESEPKQRVIINDEILALRVKPEDLEKIREPKPPCEPKRYPTTASVIVRKLRPPELCELRQPKTQSVVVAKPAPPDAPVLAPNYDGISGARFDCNGQIIPYSILGDVEEYRAEACKRGELPEEAIESCRSASSRYEQLTAKSEKKKRYPIFKSLNGSHALRNWQQRMCERRQQQCHLSRLLNKPVGSLAMNQGDGFRKTQQLRYLLDRTMPFINKGKGYRVGSEFWRQQDQLGGECDGMHATLSLTDKGYPPPIEHIGVPCSVLNVKGLHQELPVSTIHKPWHKSVYLKERMIQLAPLMDELDPHEPDLLNLEVIGYGKRCEEEEERNDCCHPQSCGDAKILEKGMEDERRYEAAITDCEDPFKDIPDIHPAPIFGPSIQFSGQPARWTGDSHHYRGQVGIEARVSFETDAGGRTTSFLDIMNDGTTCIYFDWKKVAKPNNFDVVSENIQRFYFNPGNGVIFPGDTMKFPFVFKSSMAGIFSETWQFNTHPVLCGGAALLVTLRGVAVKQDWCEMHRCQLEMEICEKEKQQIVCDILNDLLKSIQARERPRSPVDTYITEEQIFKRMNPKMYYSHEKCDQLSELFVDCFPEEDRGNVLWDLSVDSIRQTIILIPEEEDRKQELLQRLNQIISSISVKPMLPTSNDASRIGYVMLCLGMDKLVQSAIHVEHVTGYSESQPLPDSNVPSLDPLPSTEIQVPSVSQLKASSGDAEPKRQKGGREAKGGKSKDKDKDKEDGVKEKESLGKKEDKAKDKERRSKKEDKTKDKDRGGGSAKASAGSSRRVPSSTTSSPDPGASQQQQQDSPSQTPTPAVAPSATEAIEAADLVLKARYREKLYTRSYAAVCDVIDELEVVLAKVLRRKDYDPCRCHPPPLSD